MIITARTYSCDLGLFKELGFSQFQTDYQKELFVGEHKIDCKSKIKAYVTCMPAQFWRFEITTVQNQKFEVKTGSGSLSDYWPSILQIAEGMLVIKQI